MSAGMNASERMRVFYGDGDEPEVNYYKRRNNLPRRRDNFFSKMTGLSAVMFFIILTSIISIVSFVFSRYEPFLDFVSLNPNNIMAGKYLWTLVTHMFVHGGIAHLAINLFVLFSLGRLCEKIIGRKRFFWFYLISGIFAGALAVLLSGLFGYGFWERVFGSPEVFMVGASGAIFAIAGLYTILLPRIKFMIIFLPFFSLPAYIMIPLVLFVMWGVSILFNWPIGNVAHFGGFLAGVIYGNYLKRKYYRKVLMLQRMFR